MNKTLPECPQALSKYPQEDSTLDEILMRYLFEDKNDTDQYGLFKLFESLKNES